MYVAAMFRVSSPTADGCVRGDICTAASFQKGSICDAGAVRTQGRALESSSRWTGLKHRPLTAVCFFCVPYAPAAEATTGEAAAENPHADILVAYHPVACEMPPRGAR